MKSLRWTSSRGFPIKWFGIATIFITGFVVFYPSLTVGFWTDDFWYVEMVGRLSTSDYVRAYFDPQVQWRWYRPMQGIQWWIGYVLFRTEPLGYHVVQILLHAANAVLLYLLTERVTRKFGVGIAAALIYLTFAVDGLAVYFPAVVDPLLALFYLLTLWFWIDYLGQNSGWRYALAFASFVAALFSKEVAATLPLTLFLADRWLVGKPTTFRLVVERYAPFFIALIIYGWLEYRVLFQGLFTQYLGYGPGLHVLSALMLHLTILAFPWNLQDANLVVALSVIVISFYFLLKREWRILFLAVTTLLTLAPILPFQLNMARAGRYLYLPLMGSAVALAVLFERVTRVLGKSLWGVIPWLALGGLVWLLVWSSTVIAQDAVAFGEAARYNRLQFRPIYSQYPTFAPGTFLYFVDPPDQNVSGIMFAHYGSNVSVDTTYNDRIADLRRRTFPIVLYLDDNRNWHGQAAVENISAHSQPNPPARFGGSIQLDGYELVSDRIKRGDALIVLVYWRAERQMDKDYTVFAHLVGGGDQIIAGADRQPRGGNPPTSTWRPDAMLSDAVIVPIPSDAPIGKDYRLEIGLYDLSTLQRLSIVGKDGQLITDKFVVEPIQIVE